MRDDRREPWKRALATAIPTHHGMNLARPHLKIHTFQDRLILHGRVKISDVEEKLGVGANHLREKRKKVQLIKGAGVNPQTPRA